MSASDTLFEVDDRRVLHIVDLAAKSCDYGAWNVSGIPCKYALPCILYNGLEMCDFINNCYEKNTYLKEYDGMIHPLLDKNVWPHVQADDMNPPPSKRAPGRPKLNRRREVDEVPMHKKKYALRSSVCAKYDHNKRACPVNTINASKMIR